MATSNTQEAVPVLQQEYSQFRSNRRFNHAARSRIGMSWRLHIRDASGTKRSGSSRREVVSKRRRERCARSVRKAWECPNRRLDDNVSGYQYYLLGADILHEFEESRRCSPVGDIGHTLSQIDRSAPKPTKWYERSRAMSEELRLDEVFRESSYNQGLPRLFTGPVKPSPSILQQTSTALRTLGKPAFYALCDLYEAEIYVLSSTCPNHAARSPCAPPTVRGAGLMRNRRKRLFSSAWPYAVASFAEALEPVSRDAQKII